VCWKRRNNKLLTRSNVLQYWVGNDKWCSPVRCPFARKSSLRSGAECAGLPFALPIAVPTDSFCHGTALPRSSWNFGEITLDRRRRPCATRPLLGRARTDRSLRWSMDCHRAWILDRTTAFSKNKIWIIVIITGLWMIVPSNLIALAIDRVWP